jgi:hypothetical protein
MRPSPHGDAYNPFLTALTEGQMRPKFLHVPGRFISFPSEKDTQNYLHPFL